MHDSPLEATPSNAFLSVYLARDSGSRELSSRAIQHRCTALEGRAVVVGYDWMEPHWPKIFCPCCGEEVENAAYCNFTAQRWELAAADDSLPRCEHRNIALNARDFSTKVRGLAHLYAFPVLAIRYAFLRRLPHADALNAWAVPCVACRHEYAQTHTHELLDALEALCKPLGKALHAAAERLYLLRRGLNYLHDTAAMLRTIIKEREERRLHQGRVQRDALERQHKALQKALASKPAVVYLLSDGEFLKIGKATPATWSKRAVSIQTSNPRPIRMLYLIAAPAKLERELHRTFAHLRRRGEWFADDPSIHEYFHRHGTPLAMDSLEP